MEGEKQGTLEDQKGAEDQLRKAQNKNIKEANDRLEERAREIRKDVTTEDKLDAATKSITEHVKFSDSLRAELSSKNKEIRMIEMLAMRATTTIQKVIKEGQDSMEIGAQATGRIKVYGDYGKKQEFAAKIKDAIELMEVTRKTLEKLNGGQ